MTTIGKSARKLIQDFRTELPGVGAYNIDPFDPNKTRGSSFTKAVRQITETNLSQYSKRRTRSFSVRDPGPGSYSLQLKDPKKLISFTHSKRFYTNPSPRPGPGQYKSQDCYKQKIKSGIICKETRLFKVAGKNNPSPASYFIPQVIIYKKKQPITIIGQAKRQFQGQKNGPGPGSYDLVNNKIGNKLKSILNFDRMWHGKKLQKHLRKTQIQNMEHSNN